MPPRFRVGPAVVNIGAMQNEMMEQAVAFAESSLRDCMKESEMATMIRCSLAATYPDKSWQVRTAARVSARPRRGLLTRRPVPSSPPVPGVCGPEFRLVRHARGQTLHLLLHWANGICHLCLIGNARDLIREGISLGAARCPTFVIYASCSDPRIDSIPLHCALTQRS